MTQELENRADETTATQAVERMAWEFNDRMRARVASGELDHSECSDLLAVLMLCSYVSENHELLGIDGFDARFAPEVAHRELGTTYVLKDFLPYYNGLASARVRLPRLDEPYLASLKLTKEALEGWSLMMGEYRHALADVPDFAVARAVGRALADLDASSAARAGRYGCEYATNASVAELLVELAEPQGKTVLDFACGRAAVLARAAQRGAARVLGADVDASVANFSRILCFFGNPTAPVDIRCEDMLAGDPLGDGIAAAQADVVLVAPPVGMKVDERTASGGAQKLYESFLRSLPLGDELSAGDGAAGEQPQLKTVEQFSLARAYAQLAPGGTAILHVSTGILFRATKGETDLRERLVRNGCVRAMVELPAGAMYGTSIESALVVLDGRGDGDDVLLVDMASPELDGQGYYRRDRKGGGTFTPEGIAWLKGVLARRFEIPRVSKLVSVEELAANAWTLTFARYGELVDAGALKAGLRPVDQIRADIENATAATAQLTECIDALLSRG